MIDQTRPLRFGVDEQTRARWAEVLEGHRRAGAGVAALQARFEDARALSEAMRRFHGDTVRLSEAMRRFQQLTGVPERRPR